MVKHKFTNGTQKKTNGTKFSLRTETQKWDTHFEKGTCNKHKFQIWHKLTRVAQHLQTEHNFANRAQIFKFSTKGAQFTSTLHTE